MNAPSSQEPLGMEYEQELEDWLQRRFLYLCIAYFVMGVGNLLFRLFNQSTNMTTSAWFAAVAGAVGSLAIVTYYLSLRNWRTAGRDIILRDATRMILLLGAASITTQLVLVGLGTKFGGSALLGRLFYWHFTACLFLPWSQRDSLRPMTPLMIVWAICVLWVGLATNFVGTVMTVVFGSGVLVPGLAICSWRLSRHSRRFRRELAGRHFVSMRQELARARGIHESMFPTAFEDGHVRFDYTYFPMRELGGDFIHLHVGAEGLTHLALIDVTGHGLAAALTVNRLYGELERIRGELPLAEPDEVLILLNRYINLTLSRHNIYATCACATLDPYLGELRWAAAGHPPGYLRRQAGGVIEMGATTVVLGALADQDFATELRVQTIEPGDELVIYTDGVFEARDRMGKMFGLPRLKELMHRQPAPGNWPQFITSTIARHAAGRSEDDVLVATLRYLAPRADSHIGSEPEPKLDEHTAERVAEELN